MIKLYVFFLFIVVIGAFFNLSAVYNNDCKMPVYNPVSSLNSDRHTEFYNKSDVNYFYFSDIFRLKTDKWIWYFSIGDLFIIAGITNIFILTYLTFIAQNNDKKNK